MTLFLDRIRSRIHPDPVIGFSGNLLIAFLVAGLAIYLVGESPLKAVEILLFGAFGYGEAVGYTLYYATNFIFAGLAVSIAFRAGLFNIGGEGQALMGGLGMSLAALWLGEYSAWIVLPLALAAGIVFGGIWAAIPAWMQARRGSHIVITTIMMNFIAAAIVSWMLVDYLRAPGSQSPESATFPKAAWLPEMDTVFATFGMTIPNSPLNISFLIALLAAAATWFLIDKSLLGYKIRVAGQNAEAAEFGGISVNRIIVISMAIGGAAAGLVGLNELLGVQHRLIANFTAGAGFVGIAVAFMGRNHPLGIVLVSLLFGALYQGGSELAFEMPKVTRDMIVFIQGVVILFTGALPGLLRLSESLLPKTAHGVGDG